MRARVRSLNNRVGRPLYLYTDRVPSLGAICEALQGDSVIVIAGVKKRAVQHPDKARTANETKERILLQ